MAAGLTALMILLFLGNWRLTLIILASIPLSIITAVLVMYVGGQTLNTMTLGGFALAVGILVDNGTVVHREHRAPCARWASRWTQAIVDGAGEVGVPTMLSTLCICIVFVPVFLLQGTAKYLVLAAVAVGLRVAGREPRAVLHPGAGAVQIPDALLCRGAWRARSGDRRRPTSSCNPFTRIHRGFERGFDRFREGYRNSVSWALSQPGRHGRILRRADGVLAACSFPSSAEISFRRSMPARCGCTCARRRAPGSSRRSSISPRSKRRSARSSATIRSTRCSTISACPIAASISRSAIRATVGPMDGEILISLKPRHTPTGRACRRSAPRAAQALPRPAILLPARRHRRSGAEFRPARADRRARFRAEQ